MPKKLVVFGATGSQGGALINALHPDGSSSIHTIYAVHRKPASALLLRKRYPAIKPVLGDMNDSTAIFRGIGSAPDAVFFITPSDAKNEVELGQAVISASVRAGTKHIVMGGIDRGAGGNVLSGVEIWDTKHEIEAFLRQQGKITYTIIRSAAYLENFVPGFIGQVYASIWKNCVDGNKMALVSIKDIGITATKAMVDPASYLNAEINLAGDILSYEEASRIFAKESGGKKLPTANKYLALTMVPMMKELKQMTIFYKEKSTGAEVQRNLMDWEAYVRQSEYITGRKA